MGKDRRQLRGIVLCEDRRTERFIRHFLDAHGFDKRKFTFHTAPSGDGAAEAWVLAQYPSKVKYLRRRAGQQLCLLAVRDGDGVGVDARKQQCDDALRAMHLEIRQPHERIATPVPTWAIENWLLDLLGHPNIDEQRKPKPDGPTWKQIFEQHYDDEGQALKAAAREWFSATPRLPSLGDGRIELARIDS